jgi:uncharacterized BrkB/YihY/UPF0761 family membrane protein
MNPSPNLLGDIDMLRKKHIGLIAVAALFTAALLIAATQIHFNEITTENLQEDLYALFISVLLIALFLFRLALPFIGVFAVYSLLRQCVNKQIV